MLTLRALFLSRHLREKVLLLVFAAALALIWLSNYSTRLSRFWLEQRHTETALATQAQWLASGPAIARAAKAAAGRLEPAKTLDGTQLVAVVTELAHEAGLPHTTTGESEDQSTGQFAVHTIQFNITKAEWSALKTFYIALEQHSPYIGIEQFSLLGDRANPNLHTVSMKLSSVEISRTAP